MGGHEATGHADLPHEEHPGERTYVEVAIVLAIITAIEVAIWYIAFLAGVLVPVLTVLSVTKFIAVVGYFMHLKFDDKRFLIIFAGGMAISLSVVIAFVLMMQSGEYYCPGLPAEGQTELVADRC
jgi:cytochrome c oxidase subunit 4